MSIIAEAALSIWLESLLEAVVSLTPKLLTFDGKKNRSSLTEIKKWKQILGNLREVIEDAEQKKYSNHRISKWMEDLAYLADDVEDALEDLENEINNTQKRGIKSRMKELFKHDSTAKKELKAITVRIEEMDERRKLLCLGGTIIHPCPPITIRPLEGPISAEPKLCGREREKDEIINFLLRPNDGEQRFGIISVVGIGGIGKTTLAQHVLKDERVVRSFEVRAWSCISMNYDQCRIFKGIIEKLVGSCLIQDACLIQEMLHRELKDKKFLIILDDLWNEKIWELKEFWAPFMDAAPGSKFIVTTRNDNIAKRLKTVERCIDLKFLSEKECWLLFCSHSRLDKNLRPELVTVGQEISHRCAGLPLAAAIMGDLLRGKDNEEEWKFILNDGSWISKGKCEINSVLKMSYNSLPDCFKRLFSLLYDIPRTARRLFIQETVYY